MKTRLLIIVIISCGCGHFLTAQDTLTREMIYKSSVQLLSDPSFDCRGALYEASGSSISISSKCIEDYYSGKVETSRFPAGDFKFIHTQKPRNKRKEAWKDLTSDIAYAILVEVLE